MSEAAVEDASNSFLLDGDAPRLGAPKPIVPDLAAPTVTTDPDAAAPLSMVSPVLTGDAPVLPTLPTSTPTPPSSAPTLPAPAFPAPNASEFSKAVESLAAEVAEEPPPPHPMAHLMPERVKPTEASLRAAELRAAKKKKARRIKIVTAVIVLAVGALAGPPLGRWLVDAINEAGSTEPDEPATTEPGADTDVESELLGGMPAAGLEAIEDAKQLVAETDTPPTLP